MARRSGSGTRVIGVIVLVMLVCLGVYAAIIAQSAFTMRDAAERLKVAANSLEMNLNNGRLKDAYDNVIQISDELTLIDDELDRASWTIARNIPYLSDDVIVCQEMVAIGSELSSNALLPVCKALEATLGGMPQSTSDVSLNDLMQSAPSGLPGLVASLKHASDTAISCQKRAQALAPSHFDSVNAMEVEVKEVCDSLVEAFGNYTQVLDVAGVAGDVANVLIP